MTEEERKQFDAIVVKYGISTAAVETITAFISDVSDAAYQRGIDAESYANAVSYSMREDD